MDSPKLPLQADRLCSPVTKTFDTISSSNNNPILEHISINQRNELNTVTLPAYPNRKLQRQYPQVYRKISLHPKLGTKKKNKPFKFSNLPKSHPKIKKRDFMHYPSISFAYIINKPALPIKSMWEKGVALR